METLSDALSLVFHLFLLIGIKVPEKCKLHWCFRIFSYLYVILTLIVPPIVVVHMMVFSAFSNRSGIHVDYFVIISLNLMPLTVLRGWTSRNAGKLKALYGAFDELTFPKIALQSAKMKVMKIIGLFVTCTVIGILLIIIATYSYEGMKDILDWKLKALVIFMIFLISLLPFAILFLFTVHGEIVSCLAIAFNDFTRYSFESWAHEMKIETSPIKKLQHLQNMLINEQKFQNAFRQMDSIMSIILGFECWKILQFLISAHCMKTSSQIREIVMIYFQFVVIFLTLLTFIFLFQTSCKLNCVVSKL